MAGASFPHNDVMNDNKTLIVVFGGVALGILAAFAAILVWVPGDKTVAFSALGTVVTLLVPHLLSLRQGAKHTETVQEVKKIVNGRHDDLLAKNAALEKELADEKAKNARKDQ